MLLNWNSLYSILSKDKKVSLRLILSPKLLIASVKHYMPKLRP